MKNLAKFDLEAMTSQSNKKDNIKNYTVKLEATTKSLQIEKKVIETTENTSPTEKCIHCNQVFHTDLDYKCPALEKYFPIWMKTPHEPSSKSTKTKKQSSATTLNEKVIIPKVVIAKPIQDKIKQSNNTENKCIFCNHTIEENNVAPKCKQHPNTPHQSVCLNCYLGSVSGSPKYYC